MTSLKKNPNELPPAVTNAAWDEIRSRLFNKEPLRAMLAFVQARKFQVGENPRKIVEQVLQEMILDGFETGATGLLARMRSNELCVAGDDQDRETTLKLARAAIMLPRVVSDAEDAPLLYNKGYDSVRKISLRPKETFQRQMVSAGMALGNALKVHDSAQHLDCWNEQLWLALMQAHRADCVPIAPHRLDSGADHGRPNQAHNNLTDIFRLEDTACEECRSITSLSSYFTDLLSLLRNTPIDPPANTNGPDSLLKLLKQRRPDLSKLQLTCANSQTLVPYVSLVNEVLESFIPLNLSLAFLVSSPRQKGQSPAATNVNRNVKTPHRGCRFAK